MRRLLIALALVMGTLAAPATVAAETTWRVAVVVYDSINATCQGRQIVGSLVDGEQDVQEALADLNTQAARIAAAGDGAIQFTVFREGTLTGDLTPHGDMCWPAPSDVAMPTGFDSVYVLYEADSDLGDPGVNGYGGLSYGCAGCPLYATQPIWDGGQDWFDGWYFVFIHEWGNNLTAWFQPKFGTQQVPNLYADQSQYTFTGDWYDAWYGGNLIENSTGERVGLEPHVWASGTPTAGPAPSPTAKPCKNPNSNSPSCRP